MEFFIRGKVYPAIIKRVKGKTKVFFNTDSDYYNRNGFDLPNYCCGRMKCRWKSLRDWKRNLVDQRLRSVAIIPK